MFPWVVNAALIAQHPANFQQNLGGEFGVAILNLYPLKAYGELTTTVIRLSGFGAHFDNQGWIQ